MVRFIAIAFMLAGLIFVPVCALLASPSAGADCGMQEAMPDGSKTVDQDVMPSRVKSAHSQHGGTSGHVSASADSSSMDMACMTREASNTAEPSMPQDNPHACCCDMPGGGFCSHGGIGCSGVTCQTVPSLFMEFSTELSIATSYELVAPPTFSIFLSLSPGGLFRPPVVSA